MHPQPSPSSQTPSFGSLADFTTGWVIIIVMMIVITLVVIMIVYMKKLNDHNHNNFNTNQDRILMMFQMKIMITQIVMTNFTNDNDDYL